MVKTCLCNHKASLAINAKSSSEIVDSSTLGK
nr:MAG TPA: hypothetical protein [Caudoviricetes sp.]